MNILKVTAFLAGHKLKTLTNAVKVLMKDTPEITAERLKHAEHVPPLQCFALALVLMIRNHGTVLHAALESVGAENLEQKVEAAVSELWKDVS
jgi:hypothetical protein